MKRTRRNSGFLAIDVMAGIFLLAMGKLSQAKPPHDASHEALVPVSPSLKLREGNYFVLSQYPLAHLGAVDQLGLHRFDPQTPFTAGDRKLIRLFHVELGRLWRSDALRRAADPAADLPPRLAQTLDQLLKGDSETPREHWFFSD